MVAVTSQWRRSSFCQSGECAEAARQDEMIVLRSSTGPARGMVRYSGAKWFSLVQGIKAGDFDDLEDEIRRWMKENEENDGIRQ
jgi:hypothetical protein